METLSPLKRFFKLLNLDRQNIINIYIYAIFNGLIALSLPLGIQAIINFITGGQFSTSWFVLVFIVILGIVVSGVMQVMQLSLAEDLQQKIFTHSAFEFTYRIPRLRRDEIDQHHLPELVNRFFDTLTLQKGLSKILLDFSRSLLQVLFGIILLSLYHPFFIFYGLALLIILVIVFRYTAPMGLKSSIFESKYKYEVVHWMEEIARTFEGFKMAGDTQMPLRKTNSIIKNYLKYRKKHFKILVTQYSVMVGFKVLITGGLLILGGVLVLNQQMNIGQFVAAEIVIILLLTSIEKLILSFETIYDVMTGLDKIGYFTDLPLENESGFRIEPDRKGIEIHFKHLSYVNSNDDMRLSNLNAIIKPGERVAVTGVNRSGKSLFLQLAAGLYRNFDGVVSYNNIPLGNIDVMHLRGYIGENLGHDLIFEGTLLENITLGRENIKQEDVERIVNLVGLRDYVENLHNGYNEILNSGGRRLPEGASIKLVLARAFVHKPKLILLEDPFDAMDNETTDKILEYLRSDELEATVIIATKRRKYLKLMDKIIWMNNGVIRETAHYDELRKNSEFTFMVK